MLSELIHYRHLLFMLTWRDIRIRYKQTVMGFLWALLMPMLIVAAGILVRKALSVMSGTPLDVSDVASVSVKALPWAFFASSIRFATTSLTSNHNLLTKLYFPREVFPLSSVLANLFDFTVSATVLAVILGFAGTPVSVQLLWLPLLVLLLVLLTAGLGLLLSCANLFFRDVKYIVEVVLTFGIFFTPVFYDARMFGDWTILLLANPVGSLLEAVNDVVIRQQPPALLWVGYTAAWAVAGFAIAAVIFNKAESAFAERV